MAISVGLESEVDGFSGVFNNITIPERVLKRVLLRIIGASPSSFGPSFVYGRPARGGEGVELGDEEFETFLREVIRTTSAELTAVGCANAYVTACMQRAMDLRWDGREFLFVAGDTVADALCTNGGLVCAAMVGLNTVQWLIGADGAPSVLHTVMNAAGFGMERYASPFRGLALLACGLVGAVGEVTGMEPGAAALAPQVLFGMMGQAITDASAVVRDIGAPAKVRDVIVSRGEAVLQNGDVVPASRVWEMGAEMTDDQMRRLVASSTATVGPGKAVFADDRVASAADALRIQADLTLTQRDALIRLARKSPDRAFKAFYVILAVAKMKRRAA